MGTRFGSIDPGILLNFMAEGSDAEALNKLLNEESGLKGLSGISGDMRSVFSEIEAGNDRAKLAFEVFIHYLRFHIGGMLADLGRLDALVFTAGIGKNQSHVRQAACQDWDFLSLELDDEKNINAGLDTDISTPSSKVRVLVIKTQEEYAIAQACWKLLNEKDKPG